MALSLVSLQIDLLVMLQSRFLGPHNFPHYRVKHNLAKNPSVLENECDHDLAEQPD
jgi:hypothetical protein